MNQPQNTRSMFAPVIAYLLVKGCRVKAISEKGYLFERDLNHLIEEFQTGGVVNAKAYARELHTVLAKLRDVRAAYKARTAAMAPLFGNSTSTDAI